MNKTNLNYQKIRHRLMWPLLLLVCLSGIGAAYAQQKMQKAPVQRASIYSDLPSSYKRVGTTQLFYKQTSDAIDVLGEYNGLYYSSTYSDYGYKVSMQVDDNNPLRVNCLDGSLVNGVKFEASIEQQGDLAKICYTLTNTNEEDVKVSLGTHADVMIGNNDSAPITRRLDTFGQTYGLTMMDGQGAQLCVLFGSGLAGVTPVNDFWFGVYSLNSEAYQMVGDYYSGGYYMEENGNYDSGMGWCWKNRTVTAGGTVVFSYLIGVGEVNLEPNTSFEVTPDDPEGWNDLSRPHLLTLSGSYESPAGIDGVIDYAVEESEKWEALTDTLPSGAEFNASLVAMFDSSRAKHVIRFRTRDLVGNTTILQPIEYEDVSFYQPTGIENMVFTGDSIFQTNVAIDINEGHYVASGYSDNVNAGTASFNIEGVFPYSIGRKRYTFEILPCPLEGELMLSETSFVYDGSPCEAEWWFGNDLYATLEADTDYIAEWSDNTLPGTGTLTVKGINNYTGVLTANVSIDKAPLSSGQYKLSLPDEDISFDGKAHAATVEVAEGVGSPVITYALQGEEKETMDAPVNEGAYDIYLTIDDGSLYYGLDRTKIGSFVIYTFSAAEWLSLQGLYAQLAQANPEWGAKWKEIISSDTGILDVDRLEGITTEKGHVIGLDFSGNRLEGDFPSMLLTFPSVKVLDVRNNNFTGDMENIVKEVYAFIMQYAPAFTSELETLNITGNRLTGNIGILAAGTESVAPLLTRYPHLMTLWASGNGFTNVYPHLPASIVNLDLTNQAADLEIKIDLTDFDEEALIKQIPTLFVYNHQEQAYNTTPYARLGNYPPTATSADYTADKPYWGVDAFLLNGNLGLTCLENNTYKGASGDILYVSYPIANEEVAGSYCYTRYKFRKGDANFVLGVDITDLQATINYIFGNYNDYPFNFTAADTYEDGRLNVQDVVCTANIIMDAEETPEGTRSLAVRKSSPRDNSEAEAYLYVRDGEVILCSDVPVAAFDIAFEGNAELRFNLESRGYDVLERDSEGKRRFIGYTLSDQHIPAGETIIATYSGTKPVIKSAVMSNPEARAIAVSFPGDASSIDGVAAPESEAEYFTPSGLRLEKPVKGLNIVKTVNPDGTSSSKVIYIK